MTGGGKTTEAASMTTVAAQMSSKLRHRLETIAARDDRKLSYVIRKACEEYAERHEGEVELHDGESNDGAA